MLTKTAVAILSFNHPELTSRCLRAIVSAEPGATVFLLHNGSRIENQMLLRAEFPKVTHITIAQNAGFSGGCNYLLNHIFSLGRFEWALLVTNDCLLDSKIEAPKTSGLFAPLIYRRSKQKVDSLGATFKPWSGRLRHLRTEEEARANFKPGGFNPSYFYVPGTAFWVDHKSWSALGGFDEALHTYWEDVDLSVRAHQSGLTVGVHSSTSFIHAVGKTCHKLPFYTRYLYQRNRKTISRRYSPKWLRPLQSIWF